MNASDIIKSKQNGALYKAYYNPIIFQSTTYNATYPFISTISNAPTIAYSTSVNTIYTYTSNPYSSYDLSNDVNEGKYICGNKTISKLEFKADPSIRFQPIYGVSTYSTTVTNASTLSSINSYAFRPIICKSFYDS